ncbi:MAG: Asp23/Gls24 family envelope stress response protein [Anaerolineaceae bacterium]
MTSQENPLGRIYILPQAIKSIARHSALQSYGVIGLAPSNAYEAISRFVSKNSTFGITVTSDSEGLYLELNLIIEYGLRIKSVTDSVAESVKYNVEKTMGIPVKRVDVHVRGLRISNPD